MSNGPSDKYVYHTDTLEKAELVRKLLLKHIPRPCVYIYPLKSGSSPTTYDIHVATEWGTSPSEDYLLQLKQYINIELPSKSVS